jgi:hypothetical protein
MEYSVPLKVPSVTTMAANRGVAPVMMVRDRTMKTAEEWNFIVNLLFHTL